MTYLQIVNSVLRRLRENEVSSVSDTPYSKLIGDLVNVTKREIEDAWDWGVLRTTLTAVTTANLFNYVLVGSTTRMRVIEVANDTDNFNLYPQTTSWFNQQFLFATPQTGSPTYYNFNGVDSNGDSQIDFYPVPDKAYTIRVHAVVPQGNLVNNTDVLLVSSDLVIEGAVAKAISERGDDGGSQEQASLYKSAVADYIAIESQMRQDEITWRAC